jgi:hypothetical protein
MKGTHLVRVTKLQGGMPLPLSGVHVETLHLTAPVEVVHDAQTMYLCLDGEVVVDFDLEFVHLRALETCTVQQGHKLSPVDAAVVLRVKTSG